MDHFISKHEQGERELQDYLLELRKQKIDVLLLVVDDEQMRAIKGTLQLFVNNNKVTLQFHGRKHIESGCYPFNFLMGKVNKIIKLKHLKQVIQGIDESIMTHVQYRATTLPMHRNSLN
jgi:hypothetical protein